MNFLDLFIIIMLITAIGRGLLQGAVMQVFPFGGFWIGMLIGSALAPFAARLVDGGGPKAIASIATVFAVAFLLSGAGREVGRAVWRAIQRARLRAVDAALGAMIAGAGTLFAVWLVAMIFAGLPFPGITNPIHDSAIIQALDRVMPPAPSVFSRVRQLIGVNTFPDVFTGLEPPIEQPVPTPGSPEVQAAAEAAGASTVKIVGEGCGGIKTGSGFIATPNLVVTNAHVVAGINRPIVEEGGARRRSTPVLFDPGLDIAVLRVSGLRADPLPIESAIVQRGATGAVLGFPLGGSFTAKPGSVLEQFRATGRDIYGQGESSRRVYQLQANVQPGNSGGPFVRTDGEVLGVIFSASATDASVGYAITSPDVIPKVNQASGQQNAVDTGPCTA